MVAEEGVVNPLPLLKSQPPPLSTDPSRCPVLEKRSVMLLVFERRGAMSPVLAVASGTWTLDHGLYALSIHHGRTTVPSGHTAASAVADDDWACTVSLIEAPASPQRVPDQVPADAYQQLGTPRRLTSLTNSTGQRSPGSSHNSKVSKKRLLLAVGRQLGISCSSCRLPACNRAAAMSSSSTEHSLGHDATPRVPLRAQVLRHIPSTTSSQS